MKDVSNAYEQIYIEIKSITAIRQSTVVGSVTDVACQSELQLDFGSLTQRNGTLKSLLLDASGRL